jgi:hypothetical protein
MRSLFLMGSSSLVASFQHALFNCEYLKFILLFDVYIQNVSVCARNFIQGYAISYWSRLVR